MIDRHDRLIRAALRPAADTRVPQRLGDDILSEISATPQVAPGIGRFIPQWRLLRAALVVAAIVLLAALAAILVAGPHSSPQVLGYHGPPERTGVMPGPGPAGEPREAWRTPVRGPVTVLGMPLESEGIVVVADVLGTISGIDLDSGALRWNVTTSDIAQPSLVVVGEMVIVGHAGGGVSGLDLKTGSDVWPLSPAGDLPLTLAATGDRIVASGEDGKVYGIDVSTRAVRWTIDGGGALRRGAAISGDTAVVGAEGGRITAFSPSTGVVRWRQEIGDGEVMTPAIADGIVYVAHGLLGSGESYQVIALDLATSERRWAWTSPSPDRLFLSAVVDDEVYVGSDDGSIYRIDAATGRGTRWFSTHGPNGALAAIVGDTIYIASQDQHVYAVDRATAVAVWEFPVLGAPSTPAVVRGFVLVATDLGEVLAIGGSRH